MKTLNTANYVEILSSFNLGQGKTVDLPKIASFDGNTIVYDGVSATITNDWLQAFTLMSINNLVKDKPNSYLIKLFGAYNDCRLSLNHSLEDNASKVKTPLKGHVMTSDEYTTSIFVKAATPDTVKSIYDLTQSVSTNSSKAELTDVINQIAGLIFTLEQFEALQVLQAKEAEFVKVKDTFKDRAELTFMSETQIKVVVSIANMPSVVTDFTTLGYVQNESVTFDNKTMTMTLYFDNEKI